MIKKEMKSSELGCLAEMSCRKVTPKCGGIMSIF